MAALSSIILVTAAGVRPTTTAAGSIDARAVQVLRILPVAQFDCFRPVAAHAHDGRYSIAGIELQLRQHIVLAVDIRPGFESFRLARRARGC